MIHRQTLNAELSGEMHPPAYCDRYVGRMEPTRYPRWRTGGEVLELFEP
jgi:hypothetical protein